MEKEDASAAPQQLREKADKCFWLARNSNDQKARKALIEYGQELLNRADEIEQRND